ncbi:hypothetical protein VSDG_09796 [Cytospora chrysosperma]|uniref:Prenyltransferase alpha-alpha toroid domain-containing protein n=1 Tax=Cytospora chrysosperma TaxID=252740 RepID=A0A423V9C5_CYTCH|nr:hypothetical protein VSDG_09796 [Valsa sordida]
MSADTTVDELIDRSTDIHIAAMIPDIFTSPPPVRDDLHTTTSISQDQTVELCLPFLSGEKHDETNAHGIPHLDRERHIRFLHKQLGKLPPPFMAADASRPWFLYWCLNALRLLGEDVSSYRESLIETARSMQNDTGGFGGGNGQLSHLATTYAVVLALALVGGHDVYEVVDRRALWKWLCTLKHPSGGFQMAVGGEVDISHWIGGCWPLVEAALGATGGRGGNVPVPHEAAAAAETAAAAGAEEGPKSGQQPALPASWSVSPYLDEVQIFDDQDRIAPLHPVYAIPAECVADIKSYFERKQGF